MIFSRYTPKRVQKSTRAPWRLPVLLAAVLVSLGLLMAPNGGGQAHVAEALPPATPSPTPSPTPEPTPSPTPTPSPAFDFTRPAPEGTPVDMEYFSDALLIGDSRTEGLQLFSGLKHGEFYWARGMTVFRTSSEDYRVFEVDGKEYNMVELLALKQYDNVYIMLGVNELGYPAESYESGLGVLLDQILELQPNAVVYLQVMPPLNDAMCRQNGLASYINNENLSRFNEAIVRLAASKRVVLLNTAETYTGPDGQLPAELANDGCHFSYSGYTLWADYLRTHVIDRERYFASRAAALEADTTQAP